jgi:ferredoxin
VGHRSHHKAYRDLQTRLDQLPASFPATEKGFAILRLLFTEQEARLVAKMPLRPMSIPRIAKRAGIPKPEAERMLDSLADRGLIYDLYREKTGYSYYCVAPAVIGFVEFSLMRARQDMDQPALSRAYEDYFDSEDNLAHGLFSGQTQMGRTLVHESSLDPDEVAELLTHQRARDVVGSAETWGVSLCFCRHKAEHLGKRCAAPMENCLTLNMGARMLIHRGLARSIERGEALQILDRARQQGLVHIGDNVQQQLTYICNCCSCCCGQLRAINEMGLNGAVKTSPFLASIDRDRCRGCGRCARRCPVQAIGIHALPPHIKRKARMYSVVDESICLGCGLCKPECKQGALTLQRRQERMLTPENTLHRILLMALERDRLQNLLFDDEAGLHMLFLNRLSGAILRLPPIKQALLRDKLRSRFVGYLLDQAERPYRS